MYAVALTEPNIIMAYMLKTRNVEPEKEPLPANGFQTT
jgi:hypothetical protein